MSVTTIDARNAMEIAIRDQVAIPNGITGTRLRFQRVDTPEREGLTMFVTFLGESASFRGTKNGRALSRAFRSLQIDLFQPTSDPSPRLDDTLVDFITQHLEFKPQAGLGIRVGAVTLNGQREEGGYMRSTLTIPYSHNRSPLP